MPTNEPCGCAQRCGRRFSMAERAQLLYRAVDTVDAAMLGAAHALGTKAGKGTGLAQGTAAVLVAISEAESAGYVASCNHNSNGTIDRGLWQINSAHGYGQSSYDSLTNASQALAVYAKQGYKAWSTYGSPRMLAALPAARLAVVTAVRANPGDVTVPGQPLDPNADGGCVYRPNILPHTGVTSPCLDSLVGGAKMALASLGLLVMLLVLIVVLARETGAAQAAGRTLSALPTPVRRPARAVSNARTRRAEVLSRRTVAGERATQARQRTAAAEHASSQQAELRSSRIIAQRARTNRAVRAGTRTPDGAPAPEVRRPRPAGPAYRPPLGTPAAKVAAERRRRGLPVRNTPAPF